MEFRRQTASGRSVTALVVALAVASLSTEVGAEDRRTPAEPFAPLIGWWSGEGRLGFKQGQVEAVKCRATYQTGDTPKRLEQNIRCAAASGAIEVRASVLEDAGKLSGTWKERLHNLGGDISGEITPRGFRVNVTGEQLTAGMDIILRGDRQIVEIQFHNSSLVGLTLLLQKGTAARPPS